MSYPKKLPKRYRYHWSHPWTRKAKYSPGFRRWLGKHGYLSPNFTLREARCKDGTDVPRRMRYRARNHAFNLERVRHGIGDKPVQIISWYRTKRWNNLQGGARKSQHLRAVATDHPRQWVDKVGRSKVLIAGNKVFKSGGMGTYPSGAVHFDSRGYRARWSSF